MAFGLGATACSSGSGGADSSADFTTSLGTGASSGSDAEQSFTTEITQGSRSGTDEAEASDEDAMAESEGQDAAEDGGFFITDQDSLGTAVDAEAPSGGFFDDQEVRDRTENNTFEDYGVRPFVDTSRDPLSTFALDVDTASYSIARQWLSEGLLPEPSSVRVEEFVNSFDYNYPAPREGLLAIADGGPSPFDPNNIIVRIGVQAEQVSNSERPRANLTFVVDTSGSMDREDRLGLVKVALERLVSELDADDQIAIVTYSNEAEILLPPTSIRERNDIYDAIDSLRPDGSTNLEAGLLAAYDLANEAYDRRGINRVILASDGVANVGMTDPDGLAEMIRRDADRGIQLVTMGVGMGNFNDVVMETLANDGDGFYAYVNTESEADKLFSEDLVSTLLTIAIDGKIQVEFNDRNVLAYRLIGFENRAVHDDDFRNDRVDAGELGAGHQVTALYELELARGVRGSDPLGTAMVRWEDPDSGKVIEGHLQLEASMVADRWSDTDEDFRLAVTVATFAEVLRNSQYTGDIDLSQITIEAEALAGRDRDGAVGELADLIREADRLR